MNAAKFSPRRICRLLCAMLCIAFAACGATNLPAPQSRAPAVAAAPPPPAPVAEAVASAPPFTLAPAPRVAPSTVAVADFEGGSVPPDKKTEFWSTALASFLIADLAASKNLRLVDRAHLAEVLREQRLSLSDLSDTGTRLRIGKIVGAKYFIFGTYTIVGGEAALTARMDSVETGQIIESRSITGQDSVMPELARQLAIAFLTPLDRIVAEREQHLPPERGGPPASAQRYFAEGLSLEQQGQYDRAIDMYTKALTAFPRYAEARQHLQSASEAAARE
ncbi:MAG: CsgG/HfaB family protein [Candidatus Binataceae bacterium]